MIAWRGGDLCSSRMLGWDAPICCFTPFHNSAALLHTLESVHDIPELLEGMADSLDCLLGLSTVFWGVGMLVCSSAAWRVT